MSLSKSQGKKHEGSPHMKNRGNNNRKLSNSPMRNQTSAADKHHDLIYEDPSVTKLMHDRMLYLLGSLVGVLVEITVRDGTRFEGILHSASTEGDLAVCLKYARKTYDPIQADKERTNPVVKDTLMFFPEDLVELNALHVEFNLPEITDRHTFKTDVDISGRIDIKERELHKWAPDDDGVELEGDLDSTSSGNWDQFAANEKLFGLKTDFNEEIYTTHLNRSAPDYKDREKKAIKVANEIQKTASSNVHVLEERGYSVDGELDEEDLYGAVARDNRYLPPALRSQKIKESAHELSKSVGNNPSPISTLPITRRESNEKPSEKRVLEREVATTFRHFAMMEKDKLQAKKQALQKIEKDGRLAELKMFHQTFKLNVPIPADLFPLLSKGKKSAEAEQTKDEEDKKKSVSSTKSSSPIAATSPLPTTKTTSDKTKSTRQTTPAIPQTTPANAPASAPDNTQTTPAATAETTPATPQTTPANTFKFNVKASAFKPNPSAAAFVPAGITSTNEDNTAFFNHKHSKKGHLTMAEAFTPPFKEHDVSPHTIGPTWPFGNKPYRVQFNQFTHYEDDVFTGYPSPNYSYAYPYRYPQYVPGMPPMAVQQGGVPYMSPQFVSTVPISGAMPPPAGPPSVTYSPQMANVSPSGSPFPQGFPSPQRSPMISQGMPQVYQYQGAPMMMRYTSEMMPNNGNGHVMMQRPIMMDNMQYPSHVHESPANDSGVETPTD